MIIPRGGHHHDPGATISVLVSLIVEADSRLPDTVAQARHHHYTWDQIADRLATTTPAARHRYTTSTKIWNELRLQPPH